MKDVPFAASYFDGESSNIYAVTVRIEQSGELEILFDYKVVRSVSHKNWRFHPPIGNSLGRIEISGGALLEIPYDSHAIQDLENKTGVLTRLISVCENNISALLLTVALATLACLALYFVGLPYFVRLIKPAVPYSVKEAVGAGALKSLDRFMFKHSTLPKRRRAALQLMLSDLAKAANLPANVKLYVRRSKGESDVANAFALLPRYVIATDAIVNLLSAEELEAVFAHELGHLAHDDGTEMLLRGSAIALGSIAIFGGDPGTVQTLALAYVESSYSREAEDRADQFGLELMKKIGGNPQAFVSALEKISVDEKGSFAERYFSTHPSTESRILRAKSAQSGR